MITTTTAKFALFIGLILIMGVLSFPTKEKMGQYYFNSYRYESAVKSIQHHKNNISLKSLHLMKDYYVSEGEGQKAIETQLKILRKVPKNIGQLKELVKLYRWEVMYDEALKWETELALLLSGQEKKNLLIEILLGQQAQRNYKEADKIADILKQFKTRKAYISILNYYTATNNLPGVLYVTTELRKMGINLKNGNEYNIAAIYESNGEIEKSTKAYLALLPNGDALYGDEDWLSKLTPQTIANERDIIDRILMNYEQLGNYRVVVKSKLYLYENAGHEIQYGLDALTLSKRISSDFKDRVLKALKYEKKAKNNASIGTLLADEKDILNSIIFFEKAHKAAPKNKSYYYELTYLYEISGQLEKAYRLQKEYLKLIEGTKNKINYISEEEVLYAQNNSSPPLPTNEVQKTKRKIIELLISLKKEEELHEALVDYCQAYPLDLDFQKELASSYIKRSQTTQATKVYRYIHSVNPNDSEAAIYVIDHNIDIKKLEEASILLEIHKKDIPENEYIRRAIAIFNEIDPQKLDTLCNYPPLENESLVQCYLHKKEYSLAMKFLKKSNNTSDKITLAYLLLDMGNTNEAEIEIQKLEKLAPLYEKEVSQLKKYHHEIILIRSYQQSKNINAQAVMFNSPNYSFVSGDLVATTPIQIPWQAGVQLYEQSYDGMSKSNIAPLIGYKTENSGIQYRYGVLQNSHEVLGQHVLTERSYLSGGMSLNTPFTDLYTVSFNDEIKRKNFIVNYSYIFKRHQFDVSYNYSYYNFEDDSFPSESRQVVNGLYQYNHMNHFLQGMSLSDMDFSSPSIGDVTFIPITLLSYRLGYNYTRGDFSLIPAISPGMDLQSSDTLGSYYTYEATAIYRFSLEKYLRLYWEHSNINQQNISQKNTTLMLNFNYWYY